MDNVLATELYISEGMIIFLLIKLQMAKYVI